tara:strand:+ start:242 stop:394 length:153 start_codon:yes stop_codon:yes gene_type:complete
MTLPGKVVFIKSLSGAPGTKFLLAKIIVQDEKFFYELACSGGTSSFCAIL